MIDLHNASGIIILSVFIVNIVKTDKQNHINADKYIINR